MKRVKGSRGWIAVAFTILFTVSLVAVRTKAAIQPSGAAPSTLTPPVLSDTNGGIACPSDGLAWTSVTGATSYQIWRQQRLPTVDPTFYEIYSGTGLNLRVTLPRGFAYIYAAAACNGQGCIGLSGGFYVEYGMCD